MIGAGFLPAMDDAAFLMMVNSTNGSLLGFICSITDFLDEMSQAV